VVPIGRCDLTVRRPFNRTAFLAGYRAACIAADLDPTTGNARANDDPRWWARDCSIWAEIGPNASTVEAEAFASIASQVRRIAGVPDVTTEAEYVLRPSMQAEVIALAEDGANAMHQIVMPLRDIHRRQGVVIDEILGVRMVVPIRMTA
jgi:hypothetical protein